MNDELLEIRVFTRKDSAGLIIPETIFVNDGIDGFRDYKVQRIIRRDNEKIQGEDTTMFTCLVELEKKTQTMDIRFYHQDQRWVLYRM